jgi:hypothetical protein
MSYRGLRGFGSCAPGPRSNPATAGELIIARNWATHHVSSLDALTDTLTPVRRWRTMISSPDDSIDVRGSRITAMTGILRRLAEQWK